MKQPYGRKMLAWQYLSAALLFYLLTFINEAIGFNGQTEEQKELAFALRSHLGTCDIPDYFQGDWYSFEDGENIDTLIERDQWTRTRTGEVSPILRMSCVQSHAHVSQGIRQEGQNWTFLMQDTSPEPCYRCLDVLWRTNNVIQIRLGDCYRLRSASDVSIDILCQGMHRLPIADEVFTMFRKNPYKTNCNTTFMGRYQFSYEMMIGGGGICDNPDSYIHACQDYGSPYIDNQVFRMNYRQCPDISASFDEDIRYQCLGSWLATKGNREYKYAAVKHSSEANPEKKFKCLMTIEHQKDKNHRQRWVMSRFPDCGSLNSIYSAPIRLVLSKAPNPERPLKDPMCNLPNSIKGDWISTDGQLTSRILINDTNVMESIVINRFETKEIFYTCQHFNGNRYLMVKNYLDNCDVGLICFEVVPNNDNVISYKIGKEESLDDDEQDKMELSGVKKYLKKKFKKLCTNNAEWKTIVLREFDGDSDNANSV